MSKRKTTKPNSANTTAETKEPFRGDDLEKYKMSTERLRELGLLDRDHLVVSFNQPPRKK